MPVQFDTPQEAPVSSLVGGIVQDTQQLILDQMNLFRVELKHDLERTLRALIPVGVGALIMLTALIVLGIGGAHLLCWLVPEWPTWAGFITVGAVICLVGAALVTGGVYMLTSIKPGATALKGLEENVKWKTKN